jgi:hypothetical protein
VQATFTGSRVTCPRCGAWAEQEMEGTFEVNDEGTWRHLASALVSAEATRKDYEDLASLLRSAQALGLPKEEVARTVRSRVPHLAAVGDFLERHEHIATWLAAIVAVVTLILMFQDSPSPEAPPVNVVVQQPSEEQVREWIKKAVQEANRADEPPKEPNKPKRR